MNYEDRLTLEGLQAMVPKIVCGTYTGDGKETRVIELGFTPRLVFVCDDEGWIRYSGGGVNDYYGGLAFPDAPMENSSSEYLSVAQNGFCVSYQVPLNGTFLNTNGEGRLYRYFAIG